MPHARTTRKLGRTAAHRLALFRNQLASLVARERIVTTLPKAKELRPIAERVVTQGKRGTLHARRLAGRWLGDRGLLRKLFEELAPRMDGRPGGYLRIVKLGPRPGDGAEMAALEFVDYKRPEAPKPEEKRAKGKKGEPAAGEATEAGAARAAGRREARPRPERRAVKAETRAKGAGKPKAPRKAGGDS